MPKLTKAAARRRLNEAKRKIELVCWSDTSGNWQKPMTLTRSIKMIEDLEKAVKKLK